MTQYQRITGKVFGGNATATGNDPQIAQFGSALANTFVGTTDPETIQSLPAWGQGWIGAVTPETQFPPLPEMTGAMKVLSHQICGILQQGVSTWDSGTIYYTGNFASLNGRLYISQVDENQGNDPATDTTNWQEFSSGLTRNDKSEIISWGVPDYKNAITASWTKKTSFIAPSEGVIRFNSSRRNGGWYKLLVNGQSVSYTDNANAGYVTDTPLIPVAKGDAITEDYSGDVAALDKKFYPLKGVN